ncbi:MAG: DUF3789 domain-containing protein [Firmicutes bacterium]|nr:DUF3789 domain-containing protein [Bacillota bacterium]
MTPFQIGFVIGLFVGSFIGVFIMALLVAAARGDAQGGEEQDGMEDLALCYSADPPQVSPRQPLRVPIWVVHSENTTRRIAELKDEVDQFEARLKKLERAKRPRFPNIKKALRGKAR